MMTPSSSASALSASSNSVLADTPTGQPSTTAEAAHDKPMSSPETTNRETRQPGPDRQRTYAHDH
jgi:hypothetical protein